MMKRHKLIRSISALSVPQRIINEVIKILMTGLKGEEKWKKEFNAFFLFGIKPKTNDERKI